MISTLVFHFSSQNKEDCWIVGSSKIKGQWRFHILGHDGYWIFSNELCRLYNRKTCSCPTWRTLIYKLLLHPNFSYLPPILFFFFLNFEMEKLILQATTLSVSLPWLRGFLKVYKRHKRKELWRKQYNYLKYSSAQQIRMKMSGIVLGAGFGALSLDQILWSNGYLVIW